LNEVNIDTESKNNGEDFQTSTQASIKRQFLAAWQGKYE
jgi:hypothetical protein